MKTVNEMSVSELSRWYALYEGINIVAEECKERNIDFNKTNLEPLHLRKYIEKTCDIFARKLLEEQETIEKNKKLYPKNIKTEVEVKELV